MTNASSIHEAGTQSQYSGTTQRGGVGREVAGVGGVQDGGFGSTHGWFMSMYGKTHHNIVK